MQVGVLVSLDAIRSTGSESNWKCCAVSAVGSAVSCEQLGVASNKCSFEVLVLAVMMERIVMTVR